MRLFGRKDPRPSRDTAAARPAAASPDPGENSASTIIEAPLPARRDPFDPHDFPDGGGSGGAEAFRRRGPAGGGAPVRGSRRNKGG